MTTRSALRAAPFADLPPGQAVTTMATLVRSGWTYAGIQAQLDAQRWQRCGRAVVLHNGPIHPDERARIGLLNCGPRAALTGFTAVAARGLQNWERDAIHVLVPGGARVTRPPGLPLRIHWSSDWSREDVFAGMHAFAPALVLAAGTLRSARPAVGLTAAGVQQRLTTAADLRRAVERARLCRRYRLPEPSRQAVRVERSGRRRYLDAEWKTRTGRRLVAEIDGALHLVATRWWDDQLRQNEIVLSDRVVLRFPSVVFRLEERLVVDQLARGLRL